MPLTKNKTAILLLGISSDPQLTAELSDAGFGAVVCQGSRPVREAMMDVLTQGFSAIILNAPAEGFTVSDIERTWAELEQHTDWLIAGLPNEPAKQNMPERLYSFLSGVSPAVAQTSLFAMSAATAEQIIAMKSAEDTFVGNIPLEARILGKVVREVHTDVRVPAPDFGLLTRSFKLYYVFIKFSIAAMIAYVVDIGTFGIFEVVFGFLDDEMKILVATVISRVLCSIATYLLNKSAVFRSEAKEERSIVRFIILSVAQLIASWLLVWGLGTLFNANDFGNMMLKIVVDLVIFIASFTIMRDWVFKKTESDRN